MAALDVHAVEARSGSQPGRLDVGVLKTVEVFVGHQRMVGRETVSRIKNLAMVRNYRPGNAPRPAVPPRVGQLHDENQLAAESFSGGFAVAHQPGEDRRCPRSQSCRGLNEPVQNGGCLEPEQAEPPGEPRANSSACPARRSASNLHRLHDEPIAVWRSPIHLLGKRRSRSLDRQA